MFAKDTVLDMASLGPVLDEAFAAAGILLRPDVAAQQGTQPAAAATVRRRLRSAPDLLEMILTWSGRGRN